ncbi:MAG: DUF1385 domain-containing protein [Clostridia bacterium]|nr:DUF1385 domain-containing protein [Clostridia bacterium]
MGKFKDAFKQWWTGEYPSSCPSVGGQAVMEGVMMNGPKGTAITVRKSDGKMSYTVKPKREIGKKHKWVKWPVIRGVVNFAIMMVEGVKTITESADMAGLETEEPSKFEKKVAEMFHVKPDDVMMAIAVVLAVVLAVGLFFVLPISLEWVVKLVIKNELIVNLIGGVIRIGVFLTYVFLCSKLKEIRRVFMYHGAEHKTIHCFEHGDELTVENARKYTTLHPRCGTSFLMIVMVISILLFTIFGQIVGGVINSNIFLRIITKLALLPLIAGVSYEVLKWLGRAKDNWFIKILKWPGLMTQKLTTKEPDDSMLEVAIVSLKAALGDKKPLPDSYYEEEQADDAQKEEA